MSEIRGVPCAGCLRGAHCHPAITAWCPCRPALLVDPTLLAHIAFALDEALDAMPYCAAGRKYECESPSHRHTPKIAAAIERTLGVGRSVIPGHGRVGPYVSVDDPAWASMESEG